MNKKIWLDQLKFNWTLFKDYGLDIHSLSIVDKIKWSKEFYFHINKELADLINCLPNWKMHYKNDEISEDLISSNLIEEYVDVFKYFMGLGQILGISFEDIVKGYEDKTDVIRQKCAQNKQINKLRQKEVILFDIDGVINTYPYCYFEWLEKHKNLKFDSIDKMKSELGLKTYEHLKQEYRLSGAKRHQPVVQETVELMRKLNQQKEIIILFTNRPVTKYKIIYSDTLYWLKKNNIPFDAIYWSDYSKKEDIYKLNFKIKFIVEDDFGNAKNFVHEHYLVFLLERNYNQNLFKDKNLIRINNTSEVLERYEIHRASNPNK